MSDTNTQTSTTVIEVLIPGPQGPSGVGTDNIGGYAVAVNSIENDHVLAFNGTNWHNKALMAGGDMTKAIYDTKNDGKVEIARVAEAVAWSGITSMPASFTPAAHTHIIDDVTGLGAALDAKALASDVAALTVIVGDKAPLASPALTGTPTAPTATSGTNTTQIATTAFVTSAVAAITPGGITWDDISDKPVSFTPATHTHVISDVTGLSTALADKAPLASPALSGTPTAPTATSGTNTTQIATTAFVTSAVAAITPGGITWDDIGDKPSTFTPSTHSHVVSDVTGLQTILDAKAALASPALTGTPTAPTASAGTNTTQLATTAFVTTATTKNVAVVSTSGNFTVPAGVRSLDVSLWGGGGGGAGGAAGSPGGGGGGGGYCRGVLSVTPGQVIAATIGAAGTAGASGASGGSGGTTTFSTLSATGGTNGSPGPAGSGGAGGTGSGGTVNLTGSGGSAVVTAATNLGGAGGASPMGGAGSSPSWAAGYGGQSPGGGGSGRGGIDTGPGSAGAAGLIIITF